MTRKTTKYIHEGEYIAEVEIDLDDSPEGWAPYFSLKDAEKLDKVRLALRNKDLKTAVNLARIYSLKPVVV